MDQGTARKIGRLAESDLFIAEGPESFCTIRVGDAGWSGGCTARSRAVSGEPLVTFDMVESPDGNDYRVWGVAPEGVTRAAIVLKDGTRVSAPLQGGVFEVTTDDPGEAFAWTDAQGIEHSQQVLRPPVQ